MDITQEGYVRITEAANGLATITFYHPNQNSLPSRLLTALADAFNQVSDSTTVKVVVLRSAEHKTFCAGASFDELSSLRDIATSQRFFEGFGTVINAMRNCSKIVVARIHGKAVGGGVGLAAASDFCLATHFASARLSELAVGFGPFVIGPAVERKIGLAAFSQMALTPADWQTADWACQKGLYQEIFDSAESMDTRIDALTGALCGYSAEALAELKRVFWQGTEHWDTLLTERASISGRLALSDFTQAAIAAFKAK